MNVNTYFSHIMCYFSCFIVSLIGLICSVILLQIHNDQKNIYIVFITVTSLISLISCLCFIIFLIKENRKNKNASEFDRLIDKATRYESYIV